VERSQYAEGTRTVFLTAANRASDSSFCSLEFSVEGIDELEQHVQRFILNRIFKLKVKVKF
jgi:hypothetical protein